MTRIRTGFFGTSLVARTALIAGAALAASCGASAAPRPNNSVPPAGGEQFGHPQTLTNDAADGSSPADAASGGSSANAASLGTLAVVVGTITPLPPGLNPRVAITAPRDNATIRTNRVEVRLRVTDWPAPQDGRHIHLILDNDPYQRVNDPSQPVVLENLTEGTHVLRAFPGWATHESVKRDGAFALSVFHVGHRTENFAFNRAAPLLTYSRPKGDYNGHDAEHVLLDFYVTNVPGSALSATGHRVRYAIDSSLTGEATAWVPHFIDHLPDGEHHIVLDLLGPDGQPVGGPFNHIDRVIRVNRAAAADGGHAHAAPTTGSPATGTPTPTPAAPH